VKRQLKVLLELGLTTFCLSRSNLSHFSLLTSCLKFSFWSLEVSSSRQREQERLFGVPADDMDSSPVSESSLANLWNPLRIPITPFPVVDVPFTPFIFVPVVMCFWVLEECRSSCRWWWWWWKWWWEAAEPSSSSLFKDESSLSDSLMLQGTDNRCFFSFDSPV